MKKLFVFVLLFLPAFIYPANRNWYISNKSAGDASASSWSNAQSYRLFSTIKPQPGDTVFIDGGSDSLIYKSGTFVIYSDGLANNYIIYTRGKDDGHNGIPIFRKAVNDAGANIQFHDASYVELSHIKGDTCNSGGRIIDLSGTSGHNYSYNINLLYNEFHYITGTAVQLNNASNIKILHNTFYTTGDNVYTNDAIWGGSSILNLEIGYNTFLGHNKGTGNEFHKDFIQVGGLQGTTKIHHNFMYADRGGYVGIYTEFSTGTMYVYNNIIDISQCTERSAASNIESQSGTLILHWYNNTVLYGSIHDFSFENIEEIYFKNNLLKWTGANRPYIYQDNNEWTKIDFDYNVYDYSGSFVNGVNWANWQSSSYGSQDEHSVNSGFTLVNEPSLTVTDYVLFSDPGIDDGINLSTIFTTDYTGKTRSGSWDIGAFELVNVNLGEEVISPNLLGAILNDSTEVELNFSEPLENISAVNTLNYSISNGITIYNSTLSTDGKKVNLITSVHSSGTYTVQVNNVKDLTGNIISEGQNHSQYECIRSDTSVLLRQKIKRGKARDWFQDYTPDKSIDGKTMSDPASRWGAATPMPDTIIYELEESGIVSQTRISFFNWEGGRKYRYQILASEDGINWISTPEFWSEASEWSIKNFSPVKAKYIQVVSLENNQSIYAGIWETEIWGIDNVTDVEVEPQVDNPESFELFQNYPNPFNPSTKISIQLPKSTHIKLTIYNLLGELVNVLADAEFSAGSHEFNFDAKGLASGIYIYRIDSPEFVETKKMMLLR